MSAHPRSRGEHLWNLSRPPAPPGSSPLARGTYPLPPPPHSSTRLIPARAGNIVTQDAPGRRWAAHPRSRGEHPIIVCSRDSVSGSSPLARGTSKSRRNSVDSVRLIPARAGNIRPPSRAGAPAAAHPRSRGEHYRIMHADKTVGGSSPLARGKSPGW